MGLVLEIVSNLDRLCEIEAEWTALLGRCPDATVFQTPEWLVPWWRHSGSGSMWVLAYRDSGDLVGLAPLFVHDWMGRLQVTLIGTGVSDYLDLVAAPEWAERCACATLDFLRARRSQWEVCDWQDLRGESPLIRAAAAAGFLVRTAECLPCTVLPLPESEEFYWASLPHGMRRNIRRYGDRLRSEHRVIFETATEDRSGELLEQLIRIHSARWEARGERGMLRGNEPFLRAVTPFLADAGMLRIHSLSVDGKAAGLIYQLRYRESASGYLSGFSVEMERYSPGTLLLDYALRRAIREGSSVWDFLRGREQYKFQWGAQELPKYRLSIGQQSGREGAPAREEVADTLPLR